MSLNSTEPSVGLKCDISISRSSDKANFANVSVLRTMENFRNLSEMSSKWTRSIPPALNSMMVTGTEKLKVIQAAVLNAARQFYNDFEMEDWLSVEGLIHVTLFIVILSSVLVISLNLYRKIRYAIPARVNCWFCNTNTKVLYSLKDTWTCPTCHQYNGFTQDGHYNKRIPAQFIEALNRPVRGAPANGYQVEKGALTSNGLCSQCNLNQVLKVFQLASFVPVNEKNYNAEIEAEQKRLEQLYHICDQCKVVVEKAIYRASAVGNNTSSSARKDKTNVKIHKVTPTPVPSPVASLEAKFKRKISDADDSGLSFLHENCLKDVSDSDGSGDSFLSLDNLKIDSKLIRRKLARGGEISFSPGSMSPRSISPLSNFCASPSGYSRQSPQYGPGSVNSETVPLWKDYPMVRQGLSPTYSLVDSMSLPVGRPAYINCSGTSSPTQFNYQSSNLGGVFGGRKPLISPPKFSNNSTPVYSPFIRYGPYYDITASSAPFQHGHNPGTFGPNPQYFTNPISRSSSQSSGFVSQPGCATGLQSQLNSPGSAFPNGN